MAALWRQSSECLRHGGGSQRRCFFKSLVADQLGQHGTRRYGRYATLGFEPDVTDTACIDDEPEAENVAADGIARFHGDSRRRKLAGIPWIREVLQNRGIEHTKRTGCSCFNRSTVTLPKPGSQCGSRGAAVVIVVVAGLIWRDGKILICQRKPDDAFPGKWEFPGGKIERGEAPEAALARELEEELGIRAKIGKQIWSIEHQYPGRAKVKLQFFDVTEFDGEPENRIFGQVSWASPNELTAYDFLEADRPLIQKLAGESTRSC